eukprot:TRINITY_DN49682_c0_g1_i2.p1 TRINITY_DN49682_c0_g1~~TRINITY_DN49682_c0_g1_i2.p1  ORF type:complete len:347 (-),score=70.50 TRINITY_DN49682_c0_g1_i2:179-1219(-)
MLRSLVGSEMCIRDRLWSLYRARHDPGPALRAARGHPHPRQVRCPITMVGARIAPRILVLPASADPSCVLAHLPYDLLLRIAAHLPGPTLARLAGSCLLLYAERTTSLAQAAACWQVMHSHGRDHLTLSCAVCELATLDQLQLYSACCDQSLERVQAMLVGRESDPRMGPVQFSEHIRAAVSIRREVSLSREEMVSGAATVAILSSTPLIVAATSGSIEICKLLLEHGAQSQSVVASAQLCGHESTALAAALSNGDPELIRLLLEHTPFEDAAQIQGVLECVSTPEAEAILACAHKDFDAVWGLDDSKPSTSGEDPGIVYGPVACTALVNMTEQVEPTTTDVWELD